MYGYGNSMFLATHGILARGNAGTPPVNTVAPVISGGTAVGSTLTTTNGTWTGTPVISYTYQWYRGVSQIVGATNSTYTLVAADVSNSIKCRVTATNAFGSANADSNSITATWEADAQAFITAASITDPTQQSAINQLVVDLKGYNIWSKMKAIYPFVGGTAAQHKWNLKDPRDLDAAFRLVFSGGWTHSSTGALPNGTNAAADTFYIPSTNGILNSAHLSYYSRTQNNINNQIEIGVDSAGHNYFLILFWDSTFKRFYNINQAASTLFADTNTQGFFLGNRQGATDIDGWRQGVKEINGTQSSSQLGTNKVKIGARGGNFGTNSNYSSKECAFASIGSGLTDAEAANFYTAVQAFQTTLGRQV